MPILVEGGQQTRDVSYIDDVVDVWIRVIETPTEKVIGQKFFVGPGQEHTIEDLARLCHDAAGSAAPIEYVDYRPGEQGQREALTNEKARRVLNQSQGEMRRRMG